MSDQTRLRVLIERWRNLADNWEGDEARMGVYRLCAYELEQALALSAAPAVPVEEERKKVRYAPLSYYSCGHAMDQEAIPGVCQNCGIGRLISPSGLIGDSSGEPGPAPSTGAEPVKLMDGSLPREVGQREHDRMMKEIQHLGLARSTGAETPPAELHADCHDLVCNAGRQHPRGAKGVGCSCRGRESRAAAQSAALAALEGEMRTCVPEPISVNATVWASRVFSWADRLAALRTGER